MQDNPFDKLEANCASPVVLTTSSPINYQTFTRQLKDHLCERQPRLHRKTRQFFHRPIDS